MDNSLFLYIIIKISVLHYKMPVMIIDKLTVYSENLNFELRILYVLLPIQIFFIKLNLIYAFCFKPYIHLKRYS